MWKYIIATIILSIGVGLAVVVALFVNGFTYDIQDDTIFYTNYSGADAIRDRCSFDEQDLEVFLSECQRVIDDSSIRCVKFTTTNQCLIDAIKQDFLSDSSTGGNLCGISVDWSVNIIETKEGITYENCKV